MSYVFAGMLAVSFMYALISGGLGELSTGMMDSAGSAVELLISISGMICMWSGFMRIAKDSGVIERLSGLCAPLLRRLFPDVGEDSDAFRCISMNFSANLLGLGNAATPLGISAMRELQRNRLSDTATDSMLSRSISSSAYG